MLLHVLQLADQVVVHYVCYVQYPVPSVELTVPAGDPGYYFRDVAVQRRCLIAVTFSLGVFSMFFFSFNNGSFSFPSFVVFLWNLYLICATSRQVCS